MGPTCPVAGTAVWFVIRVGVWVGVVFGKRVSDASIALACVGVVAL